MPECINLDPATGILPQWKVGDTNLFFPITEINGKQRGGAFSGLPFAELSHEQVSLPKHGLLRLGGYEQVASTARDKYLESCRLRLRNNFRFPWDHFVNVAVHKSGGCCVLTHHLEVKRIYGSNSEKGPMPASVVFHPFFATFGNGYKIQYGDVRHDQFTVLRDNPFFIPRREESLILKLGHGEIQMYIRGDYTGFCVWTDDSRYICVEPVMLGDSGKFGSYQLLQRGESRAGMCIMAFTPH